MIERKADSECVSMRINRICERHKEIITDKQKEVSAVSSGKRLIGKERAIKLILDDYDKQKEVINELRSQLRECMKIKSNE